MSELFNKYAISKHGLKLHEESYKAMNDVMKQYIKKGYLPRDIAQVMHEVLFEITTSHNLEQRAK